MIPILFNEKMWCDNGDKISPSSKKPKHFIEYVKSLDLPCDIKNPLLPLTKDDFYQAHSKDFVDGVFDCKIKNGFDTISKDINETLYWTSSSMFFACRFATPDMPACAPVSGFHHAGYNFSMGYCTFNGLIISALKLLKQYSKLYKKIAIIDCDAHYGNGTDDIIDTLNLKNVIYHNTFGKKFPFRREDEPEYTIEEGNKYLNYFSKVKLDLTLFKPDLIIYQAGADPHINDPYGKILTTEQMYERDIKMFTIAKELSIPLAWNLAGGYQVDLDGSITKVLDLHINTVKAAISVYQ